MLEYNTSKVNKSITYSFAICSLAFVVLLITNYLGLYHFDTKLLYTIKYLGIFASLSPFILYKLKLPDKFIMYYSLVSMAALVGVLGTFTGIGIYISYVLLPVISCLYFSRKLTFFVSCFSYACMVFGVWYNTKSRWEITYKGYSHMHVFLLYVVGFTIEYLVVMLFIHQIVKRAHILMNEQQELLRVARADKEKYQLLADNTSDIIFEYNPLTHKYTANRSIYADASKKAEAVVIENLEKAIGDMEDRIAGVYAKLLMEVKENDSVFREIDASYKRADKLIPLWFQFEAYVLRGEGRDDVQIVGKMHNITTVKINEMSSSKDRFNDMYLNNMSSRSSLIKTLRSQIDIFTEEDFRKMAEAHQLLATISDDLKDADDIQGALQAALGKVASFLGVDRIDILRGLDRDCYIGYEWCSKVASPFIADFSSMSDEDLKLCRETYDQFGYLEFNVEHDVGYRPSGMSDAFFNMLVKEACLGTQFWIPTLKNKEYSGVVAFDKYDTTLYTPAEKFIMAEVVNTVVSTIERAEAEASSVAKSAYLSNMSHEIRTPMNAILGMSEVALREDMPESIKQCLLTIRSSSKGLLGIINDILDFSKIESGKIDIVCEEYETMSLINDVYTMGKARLGDKKLDFRFEVDENIPCRLYGDLIRVKQIMVNLVTNGIKYTDKGSVVVSVGKEVGAEPGYINFVFKVKDTGLGIKEEDMKSLFGAYAQLDTKKNHHKEGTGLGLAITKQLLELMDGQVKVESVYGEGSTFSVSLPQKVVDDTPAGKLEDFKYVDELEDSVMAFTAEGAKVLLVDDNDINLEVAKMLFAPLLMDISTAHDGAEAVSVTKDTKFDLILMDNFMPIMDGSEAAKAIRADEANANRSTPIIALTADAVAGVKEQLIAAGMNDFVAKPINTAVAVGKIKKWLGRAV